MKDGKESVCGDYVCEDIAFQARSQCFATEKSKQLEGRG